MNITITSEFKKALDLFENTNDCFYLDGEAGTGKTTLINYWEATTKKTIVKLAPTGAAAVKCKGQTIHSFFHFPIGLVQPHKLRFNADFANMLSFVDTIVLDEVSMIRADIMHGINEALRIHCDQTKPFGGIQIIAVGDLYQLAPIVGNDMATFFDNLYSTPYFFSLREHAVYPFRYMKLTIGFRQKSAEFLNALNNIREGRLTEQTSKIINSRVKVPGFEPMPMFLSSVNRRVDQINIAKLNAIQKPQRAFKAEIYGKFDKKLYPGPEVLLVKEGARVAVTANFMEMSVVNGSTGEIVGFNDDDEAIIVKIDDTKEELFFKRYEWDIYQYTYEDGNIERKTLGTFTQFPLVLGYARTIHKSQGSTYTQPVLLSFEGWFPPGLVYVGLSRATELENVYLSQKIRQENIAIDPRIGEFLNSQINVLEESEFPYET